VDVRRPGRHHVIHHRQDIRTGGSYLMEVHDSAKNQSTGPGVYREVTAPEKSFHLVLDTNTDASNST